MVALTKTPEVLPGEGGLCCHNRAPETDCT
ncbi:MAG: hypothetical protein JWO52_4102 [Gammaproteobacteria bacterium]|nr:hypothetical protein [Gammaproteobacteria bacterium]